MKTTVTEMKNAFDGLVVRLDTAEERISELEDISIESLKTKKQGEKYWGKKTHRISKDCGTTTQGVMCM